ncbi:aromatic amino acid DMT transporter YddG [Alcaligenes sp. SORT26]|uniref:aromatic amino acid DMT transporter YddG n=1 Tax=Alcaligenes sp. SORT26 TaxID=2813780 RepID=UPI001A9EAFD5|nr:aromatic amino acid DMT transporter YddG [Alcaligenes sp. SORT26]QTC01212.1 aromatic amino acid DMT transporter YddG [Alcaligenes sp. SORT26]
MKQSDKATLIGLIAIVLWSTIVGLIRSVSDYLGATGGAALIYTLASVFLLLSVGWVRLREFPRRYLIWGSILFVCYELCLALSIGYAHNSQQAIEVGMVNYLWPTFTIVAAILFNGQKANWLIAPGLLLSMMGISWILGGEQGLSLHSIWLNVQDNPLSYGLAFTGALIWAGYSTMTARIAQGKNGITLFFMLTAGVLWIKYLGQGAAEMVFTVPALVYLLLAAIAMGFGYAAWNVGILHGNVTILAGASYFIPVFSAALSTFLLQAPLTLTFWQGSAMVCLGALLCWLATRTRRLKVAKNTQAS